ncbi:MAG TPA: alpha/beta fold hydrolase, partial [Lacipirellulaceae bacterium]|nr:alpha/beta fold hydrolase [Lacipirellulaceae bacterium]
PSATTLPFRLVFTALLLLAGGYDAASAQGPGASRTPPPQRLALTTKDGVQLGITYYPSTAGQQAVPVILLHDFNETQAVFEPLAQMLQTPPPELLELLPKGPAPLPRAVVTVDLRGHGESKTALAPDGGPVELDANRFGPEDFQDMVLFDLEAVRGFLVAQNDAGMLNLNKLCLVGAGMGASVALNYAARDWAIPPLAARKQGQDVKALALISPRRNFRGLTSAEPLKFPPVQSQLSIHISYGSDDPKAAKDAEAMAKVFERYHPQPASEDLAASEDFFVFAPATPRQGSDLLTAPGFELAPRIAVFIEKRLGRHDFPYIVRKQ